jgi:hypothetical protein
VDLPFYAFARPNSGEVHWLILPTVSAEVFSLALENFAREVQAGKKKRILLVVDQAGWHTAKKKLLGYPKGYILSFYPLALLTRVATLRKAVDAFRRSSGEAVANQHFEEIEELEEALVGRCLALRDQPRADRSYIRYHWWPDAA